MALSSMCGWVSGVSSIGGGACGWEGISVFSTWVLVSGILS